MKSSVLRIYAVCAVACAVLAQSEPEANTKFGKVRGVWLETGKGAKIAGFLGLPFAEPPIGQLRFENPKPWTEQWNDTRNAMFDGPMCMQVDDEGHATGEEDCLYLNIFTSTLFTNNNETQKKKLSVLVFVHGGSFNRGSSNSVLFSPTYLLDYEIVLVTLNYRLNVLGFFSTGNEVSPGNYGLKDIVAALTWVHDNIQSFGGDPNSVTLMGQSSGAASVQLLAYSDATEGLFHKLITMSGSATAPWAFHSREDIRNSSMYIANLLKCRLNETEFQVNDGGSGAGEIESATVAKDPNVTYETDIQVVQCMKDASARNLVELGNYYVWRRNPVCIFGPTLEAESKGAVLTVHPEWSVREGLFRDLPWITGVTDDEGLLKTTDLILNNQIRDELLENFDNYISYVLEMGQSFENETAAISAIIDFYFNKNLAINIQSNITQLIGDALITWPSYNVVENQIKKMKSNVYFYLFSYQGTFSTIFRDDIPYRFGAAHGDDLNYLMPYLNAKYAYLQLFNTMGDRTLINVMSEMWTNFVKTGVPSARLTSSWEPYQKHRRFMRFGDGYSTDRVMQSDFLNKRMAFWSELMSNFSLPVKEYKIVKDDSEGTSAAAPVGVHLGCSVLFAYVTLMSYFLIR